MLYILVKNQKEEKPKFLVLNNCGEYFYLILVPLEENMALLKICSLIKVDWLKRK